MEVLFSTEVSRCASHTKFAFASLAVPGQVSTERDVSRTDTLHVSRARGINNHHVTRSSSLLKGTAGMQLLCSSKVVANKNPKGPPPC